MPALSHLSNFSFLKYHDERLAKLGREAEQLASLSPSACLMTLRTLAELMAREAAAYLGLYGVEGSTFFEVLRRLERESAFHGDIQGLFHDLRQNANDVVHGEIHLGNARGVAIRYLRLARRIAIWFHQSFGQDPDFEAGPFIDPPNLAEHREEVLRENKNLRQAVADIEQAIEEANTRALQEKHRRAKAEDLARQLNEERNFYREIAEEYEARIAELQALAEAKSTAARDETKARVSKASDQVILDEKETRAIIDLRLRRAGWLADTEELRWSQGTRPEEGLQIAIAEVPVGDGFADYILFDGLDALAVIEAKRRDQPVRGGLEQAKRYARDFDAKSPIPLVFASNGRDFHQQISTHCGIWFQDLRRPTNQARHLADWYTPQGIRRLLNQDLDRSLALLKDEPFDYLGLRYYQREAIQAIEYAISKERRKALLAMATGTGKTRTAIGLVYRFIKSGLFSRVLFLVDRKTLGDQAFAAFQTTKLEGQLPFTEIYDTKSLADTDVDLDTNLVIATVQSMVHRLFGKDESRIPHIDQFDCIIVDEAHRGYNLDREMSDTELAYRDSSDYISKYRRVLDHFDAVKIGLTATPALHTTEIFNAPVYTYRYQTAVLDGYLVDQQPPIKIETRLSTEGLRYQAGQEVKFLDRKTGEIDFAFAPDELNFDVDSFNKTVIAEGFNKAICRELAERIDPEEPGKTLIFCVTEDHAQMVLIELTAAYADLGRPVTEGTIKVITGYTDDPKDALLRYKNEKKPSIAITVDYLTTGVDVPPIVNLVFLRRVKSRILYEQMKGRATRLCPEIGKTAFRVFDCVDLSDALESVTDMKPVVQRPSITPEQLYQELTTTEAPDLRALAHRELLAKLNRRLKRLTPEGDQLFGDLAGLSPEEFLQELRDQSPEEAALWMADKESIITQLSSLPFETGGVIFDETPDEVTAVTRGTVEQTDYLLDFQTYINANLDEYEALKIVTQRPRELTRQSLQDLRQQLARQGYHSESLQKAWARRTNQDIAASIMGFIRQAALGEPLIPYEERVKQALHTLYERHQFSEEQRKWLHRIGQNLIQDQNVADPENLDQAPAFRARGGFQRINETHFDGRLQKLLAELNAQIWTVDEGA